MGRKKNKKKHSGTSADPGDGDAPRRKRGRLTFAECKKSMASVFSRIRRDLRDGEMPTKDDLTHFYDMTLLMTSHPEKGAEHFEPFLDEVDGLLEAADRYDRENLGRHVTALEKLRQTCHKRYR